MTKKRPKRVHVPRVCSRCQRRLTTAQLRDGMAMLDAGRLKATVCNSCLTLEECADMILLEATHECGLNTDGRILVRAKQFQAE